VARSMTRISEAVTIFIRTVVGRRSLVVGHTLSAVSRIVGGLANDQRLATND
jgi:hypothetical protein